MPFGDNTYSRLVAAIKVLLPLAALAILSLVFIVSQPTREGEPLRFVEPDAGGGAEERLTRPDYRSVTENGSVLHLTAEALRPAPGTEGVYTGTALTGQIARPDGVQYDMTGAAGRLDEAAGTAWITGDVRLLRNDGHTAISEALEIGTDLGQLVSPGPVRVFGPLGTLDADSMEMLGQPDLGSGTVTVFRGNVRVVYDPGAANGSEP